MRSVRHLASAAMLLAGFLALSAQAQYYAVEQIDKGFFISFVNGGVKGSHLAPR